MLGTGSNPSSHSLFYFDSFVNSSSFYPWPIWPPPYAISQVTRIRTEIISYLSRRMRWAGHVARSINIFKQEVDSPQFKVKLRKQLSGINSTQHTTWEADSHSSGQQVLHILHKPNFHHRDHNNPPLVPKLNHYNSAHAPLKTHFDISLSFTPNCHKRSLYFRFSVQTDTLIAPCMLYRMTVK